MRELAELRISAGFTDEDQRYLRLAGEVLAEQTGQIVHHWRNGIIASIPNLARHSHARGEPHPRVPGGPAVASAPSEPLAAYRLADLMR